MAGRSNKASLRALDAFVMPVRRRLSLRERPIATARHHRRFGPGYSAYPPRSIGKLLERLRVFDPDVRVGTDTHPPARRLELATGQGTLEDLVSFPP